MTSYRPCDVSHAAAVMPQIEDIGQNAHSSHRSKPKRAKITAGTMRHFFFTLRLTPIRFDLLDLVAY